MLISMRKPKIKHHLQYSNNYIGESGHNVLGDGFASRFRIRLRYTALTIFPAIVIIILSGCSSNSGNTNTNQPPAMVSPGTVILTGRTMPVSTKLTSGAATPDGLAITFDDAAISKDGDSYENILSGPVVTDIDAQTQPVIGQKGDLAPDIYKSIKLTISNVDWNVNWSFTNPSPCDGATNGSASGSLDMGGVSSLYFNTADLGGNTLLHYQSAQIFSGYAGDADHPFLLPAPIQVMKDETTMVNLVVGIEDTLGCSHLSVFNRTDGTPDPNVSPLREISGTATQLSGPFGLTVDTGQQQLIATNSVNSTITVYPIDSTNNTKPLRTIRGPDTRLNGPTSVALYSAGQAGGSGDEYIVANRDNNSIATYTATSSYNAAPVRTIWGSFTGLSKPTGLAVNLDPLGNGDPNRDELLIANSGNDSLTSYTRVGDGNAFPIVTLQGSLTQLDHPCGININKSHHEVFVTNKNSNTITVYDLFDLDGSRPIVDTSGSVVTSPHINIPPLLTILSSAGFDKPCGIVVDNNNAEIIVANGGNDTVSYFDLGAVPTPEDLSLNPVTAPLTLTPKRGLSGPNTGLHDPVALKLNGGELWVAHNGGNATMVKAPSIIPAVANEAAAANIKLNGDYNIVQFGIDFHKGTNGFGIKIPVIHSVRGKINFDAKSTPWPDLTFQLDSGVTQSERQIMEPSCTQPDLNPEHGFFGIAANNSFYAFSQNNPGMINGFYLPNGNSFAGVSYNGEDLYFLYGIKSTNVTIPYFSDDGTASGKGALYATANYTNYFYSLASFVNPPSSDTLEDMLSYGYVLTDPLNIVFDLVTSYYVQVINPMGRYEEPSNGGIYGPSIGMAGLHHNIQTSPITQHAGGFFENPGYGMVGAISLDSRSFIFMNDTILDTNGCRVANGIGIGLRQQAPNTIKTSDIKGTYYMAGIGDKFLQNERGAYISMKGSISFDGVGNATLVQNKNTEGDITSTTTSYFYQVVPGPLPGGDAQGKIDQSAVTNDILYLYHTLTSAPYAYALIGVDKQVLAFFENGGENRILGVAMLQN